MNKLWYWVGGAILILLILFFIFYQFGRSKGKTLGSVVQITPPANASFQLSTPTGGITAAITAIASKLYNDMNGINWFGFHDNALWLQVAGLTDGDLINVCNSFNQQYQVSSKSTLIQWIQGDVFNADSTDQATTVLTRLQGFGAK